MPLYRDEMNQKLNKDFILEKEVRDFIYANKFSELQLVNSLHSSENTTLQSVIYCKKFPLSDELLQKATVADPLKQMEA